MDLFGKEPRPRFNQHFQEQLYKKIAEEISNWGLAYKKNMEDLLADIEEVFTYMSFDDDGYEIAKRFENKGWSVNFEFCKLMNDVGSWKNDIMRAAIKKWGADNDIEPELEIGTEVFITIRSKEYKGRITKIYLERATYVVHVPGVNEEGAGFLVNFEDVKHIKYAENVSLERE